MLQRLRRPLEWLRFDPARTRLGWWLAASQVAVVLLVAAGISAYAIGRLHALADQQGKARVQLAGAMAREDLRRVGEDALTQARVLADRPTLQRLLSHHSLQAVAPFLRRFCKLSGIDACAVYQGPTLVAQAGAPVPWAAVVTAAAEQGETFLADPPVGGTALIGAVASPAGQPQVRVFTARLLNGPLARLLGSQVGAQVRLVDYRSYDNAPVDDFTALHAAALADGNSAVRRINALGLYAASFPVFASTGEAVVLIDARLPAAAIDRSAAAMVRHLLLTALVLAILAVLAGLVLTQRVTRPVQALTEAATRLGRGDFSASIPTQGAAEVGVLARTMEDMRRNLVELTGTLRRREAEAQAVLTGIVEGVYAVDHARTIRYLNPQAARLLGIEPSAAVGRFCGDVLRPRLENGQRPCENDCPIVAARTAGTARAVEHLQAGGHGERTAIITSSGIMDGLQVQVIRDETELEAVRRARDSVLAHISHEFRTPLAAQLASIELLRDGLHTLPPAQREELVCSLERGTQRLTRLIDNLLESVRIEAGQLGLRRQSVDLAEVVDDARALIGTLLASRGQRLEVRLPPDLPPVSGDQTRLAQVYVNLLANGSKFAPEGSTLRIGAAVDGTRVCAWVEDEGPGLQDGENHAIFERFRRGGGEEPEPGGLGLGLWIVKSIIDRHGGTIAAARLAGRTRFTFTLPVSQDGP